MNSGKKRQSVREAPTIPVLSTEEKMELNDPAVIIERLQIRYPLIGIYDAPDPAEFKPLLRPKNGGHQCLFMAFKSWLRGITLHLTGENSGCRGCGRSMFNRQVVDRDEFLTFLSEGEGLKQSRELMAKWLDVGHAYEPKTGQLFIGPLKPKAAEYIKTITFFVNPDQLSALIIGAHYHHSPDDRFRPVISPFGSGCMQMLSALEDLDSPQAIIGSTDLAMRQHLPADILAFTVTVSMFNRLCQLDERSFLFKPFLERLKKSRGKKANF
jgi:hypothetical protein